MSHKNVVRNYRCTLMQERLAAEVDLLRNGTHSSSREPVPDVETEMARLQTVRLRGPLRAACHRLQLA